MLSERALHEVQNHLFCDDKISSFRNWLIEVWMSADSGRIKIQRFSSDSEQQKQVLQETVIFCFLVNLFIMRSYLTLKDSQLTTSAFSALGLRQPLKSDIFIFHKF